MNIPSPPIMQALDVRAHLLARARAYCDLTGLSLPRVSTLAAGDGKFLPDCARGRDFSVGRYQRVMDWFANNWPQAASA